MTTNIYIMIRITDYAFVCTLLMYIKMWIEPKTTFYRIKCCRRYTAVSLKPANFLYWMSESGKCYRVILHYSNVTRGSWHLKSSTYRLFVQHLIQPNSIESIEFPHYWPTVSGIDHYWEVNSLTKDPVRWTTIWSYMLTGQKSYLIAYGQNGRLLSDHVFNFSEALDNAIDNNLA